MLSIFKEEEILFPPHIAKHREKDRKEGKRGGKVEDNEDTVVARFVRAMVVSLVFCR
jgi:hypothetical protein